MKEVSGSSQRITITSVRNRLSPTYRMTSPVTLYGQGEKAACPARAIDIVRNNIPRQVEGDDKV